MRFSSTFSAIACALVFGACAARAGTIIFSGAITQSTPDGTGPAVNNPSLNNIADFQAYSVTLVFPGTITTPGNYDLTGVTFYDPSAPASEVGFSSMSLTITANGGFDEFSLLACLTSGSGCGVGNQLDASFKIPAAMLNSQNVAATGLDQPHPLDLLEDDGVTDIQGSITTYSAVPEPSPVVALFCALAGLVAAKHRQIIGKSKKEKNV